jgi:hypothetical protein
MLELVAIIGDGNRHLIIHAMKARPNFLALFNFPGENQ